MNELIIWTLFAEYTVSNKIIVYIRKSGGEENVSGWQKLFKLHPILN